MPSVVMSCAMAWTVEVADATSGTGVWATPSMLNVTVPDGGPVVTPSAVTTAESVSGWPAVTGSGARPTAVFVVGSVCTTNVAVLGK